MTTRIDLISGIGWMLFRELHEQYTDMPGNKFLKLFEQTYHCRVGSVFKKSVGVTNPMKHYYMEFTPKQFTIFQLKYGGHPQGIVHIDN